MREDEAAARARQRALVRRGYDAVSRAYRGDDGGQSAGEGHTRYAGWVAELAERLHPGARLTPLWDRFVPESEGAGRTLILARAC